MAGVHFEDSELELLLDEATRLPLRGGTFQPTEGRWQTGVPLWDLRGFWEFRAPRLWVIAHERSDASLPAVPGTNQP
jgi:hypothetical protein